MTVILVTGVNGFIGSNVALQLIDSGYKVRGTIRNAKLQDFKVSIGDKFPALELVPLDDVATSDMTEAMRGVGGIIHVAAPLPFGGPGPKENLNTAIEGYLNVLRQAVKNGVSNVVLTGSWASTIDPSMKEAFEGKVSTEKDWGSATEEEFIDGNHDPMWIYLAAKILAERAAWKFAEQQPSLDLSVVIPPFVFGPYVPSFPFPVKAAISSNQHIYSLLSGTVPPPLPPVFCDVRDVAKAHVAALSTQKDLQLEGGKRFLVCGGFLEWSAAVEYLHQTHPELKSRLPAPDVTIPPYPGTPSTIDVSRAKATLAMVKYYSWKETLDAAVDALLEGEKTWKAAEER